MPTVKKIIKITGKGIHSGLPVNMLIKPSKKQGIFFQRTDLNSKLIPAIYSNVGDTKMRNTTIGDICNAHVQTIEHLMAALFMNNVDSVVIQIDSKETPILDGSANIFYKLIKEAGTTKGDITKIIVKREICVSFKDVLKKLPLMSRIKLYILGLISRTKNDGYVKLGPTNTDSLNISAELVYSEQIIGHQQYHYFYDGTKKSSRDFIINISKARTFGKYSEWDYLKKHGMARGADKTNVIALNYDGDGTLNKLIWPDEFVRHKIIDIIGDMFTSGGFIIGNLESYKGSHAMNNLLLYKLFSNKNNYKIIKTKKG